MPHVTVKMYAGRDRAAKQELADRIGEVMQDVLGYGPESVSIAIHDVAPSRWMTDVYEQDITAHESELYKRPGYGPLA